jgi:hypothetical protein
MPWDNKNGPSFGCFVDGLTAAGIATIEELNWYPVPARVWLDTRDTELTPVTVKVAPLLTVKPFALLLAVIKT